jgi:hypothetical protein
MGVEIGEIADGVNEHSASDTVNKLWRSIHRINQQKMAVGRNGMHRE